MKTKLSKKLTGPMALMFWAVIASGLVLASVVIWTDNSQVNIIGAANVQVFPGLETPLELVQGGNFTYSVNVTNVATVPQTYDLSVMSGNPGVSILVSTQNATAPAGQSVFFSVLVTVGNNATGFAALSWVLTQG